MGYNRLRIVVYIALLMGLTALVTTHLNSPRIIVICSLLVFLFFALVIQTLSRLEAQSPTEETPIKPHVDEKLQLAHIASVESRLEYAPTALFLITAKGNLISPLNNYARRLLAPGSVSDSIAFSNALIDIGEQQRKMISFDTEKGQERALVAFNNLHIGKTQERIVAVLPIESELETVAFKAWEQLVHVLTHEIMNSLTPVASLSRTAVDLLNEWKTVAESEDDYSEVISNLFIALDAISRRSDNLVHFVSSYRSLTNVPAPIKASIQLTKLFARVSALIKSTSDEKNRKIEFTVEPATLEVMIDAGQLEQALLNLIKNAEEATDNSSNTLILINARLTRGGRLRIEVADNGPGISDNLIEHIFTPFFTTKLKGNGIGLAMVRQLVHNNGGTVRYVRKTNSGAKFVMVF